MRKTEICLLKMLMRIKTVMKKNIIYTKSRDFKQWRFSKWRHKLIKQISKKNISKI